MKKKIFQFLPLVSVFIFALCVAYPVFAHGGEPRLEINPERLNPGAVLEIRGVDFESEEEITLTLIGPQTEIQFGTVTSSVEGEFILNITLPASLGEGSYTIRAKTSNAEVASPVITVWGTAIVESGGDDTRQEDDGLLAPMPTFVPNANVTAPPPANGELPRVSTNFPNSLTILSALIGLVIVVFAARKFKNGK